MSRYYNHVSHEDLLRETRAILKFCRDHQYPERGLEHIKACEAALESGDFRSAIKHFEALPLGGMGCFNDWFPPVVFEHENDDYVWTVFMALLERWCRLMMTASGKSK